MTTPIWSQDHLLRALAQVGFQKAETHREAVPLESWRGIPLGGEAHVVVRRDQIGAAGDDFGFVRNTHGSFDAVISEIHFNRFDRRWLEDLARRHDELARAAGTTPPANLPPWSKRELGAVPALPQAPGYVPPTARAVRAEAVAHSNQQHATRARAEAAVTLDELRKKQKKSDGPGCAISLIAPMVLWFVLSTIEPGFRGAPGFFGVVMPLWVALVILRVVQINRRTRAAAAALIQKLPSGDSAKAAAEAFLETKLKPLGAKSEDALVKELLKALRERET